MGIKNLKTLLLETGFLHKINNDNNIEKNFSEVFVDTMSVFMSLAHCVYDLEDLKDKFYEYIQKINNGNVTLFIDRGNIDIKEKLRFKRKTALTNTIKRKTLEIDTIYDRINKLNVNDAFYEEIKTDFELKIQKLKFHNFLSNNNNVKFCLNESLLLVKEEVKIVYCDGIDAEFVMCCKAKELNFKTGNWPILISNDHDTLLFSSFDFIPKIIKTITQIYYYIPCLKSKYLSKIVTLVNGCDFFPGLYGICITTKSLNNIQLFDDFNIVNIVKSLTFKNYVNKSNKIINIDNIINFVNNYASLDSTVYHYKHIPDGLTIQEFLFSALYKHNNFYKNTLTKNNMSMCAYLICVLSPKKNISVSDISKLKKIVDECKIKKKCTESHIMLVTKIFGYEINKQSDIIFGILNFKNLMLCFDDTFYFNENNIIVNKNKNNIINIG
ncbi:54R protein [Yaba-like disease virus]|uniref:54R protein n=1 Tax=Yaba-like disease virus TaxID=132475 RepID=Q9DHQ9_YLDV|nr:54R protein [Yaba-like disease virus]CAC21292.1 54R protein [Yaba-like disease virus]